MKKYLKKQQEEFEAIQFDPSNLDKLQELFDFLPEKAEVIYSKGSLGGYISVKEVGCIKMLVDGQFNIDFILIDGANVRVKAYHEDWIVSDNRGIFEVFTSAYYAEHFEEKAVMPEGKWDDNKVKAFNAFRSLDIDNKCIDTERTAVISKEELAHICYSCLEIYVKNNMGTMIDGIWARLLDPSIVSKGLIKKKLSKNNGI